MSSENDIKEMMKMAKTMSDIIRSCALDKKDTEKDIDMKISKLLTTMESSGALSLLEKVGNVTEDKEMDKNKEKVE